MDEVLKRLVVRIGYEVDEASNRKAEQDQGKLQARAVAVGNLISGALGKAASLAAGAIASLPGLLANAVEGFADFGSEIADTSKKLGIATGDLQRLRHAAKQSGVDTSVLTAGLRELAKGAQEAAAKGTGPFAEGLGLVGVSLKELEGLSAEQQLQLLSDALGELAPGSERTAAALKLFGGAGADMLPLLEEGGAGIKALGDQAEALGLVLDKSAIDKADKLGDTLDLLGAQAKAAGAQVVGELVPTAIAAAEGMQQWAADNQQFIQQDLPAVLGAIVEAGGSLLAWLADVISEFRQFGREVGYAYDEVAQLAGEIRDGLQPAIEVVSGVVEVWGKAFVAVNTAIGDGIATILEYIGVLDTLRAAWDALPFTGESIDDLTERLHGGTGKRGPASFLTPENEARRQAEAGARVAQDIVTQTAIAAGRETQRQAEAFAEQARQEGRGTSRGAAREAYLRSLRKPKGGGGKGASAGKAPGSLLELFTGQSEPADDDNALDFLMGALGFGGPQGVSGGGGSSPLAGAHFSRVDASFNADTTIEINLPPELASLGGAALARSIADEVRTVIDERNEDAWQHYEQTSRAL